MRGRIDDDDAYEAGSDRPLSPANDRHGTAVAAMVLGIVAIVLVIGLGVGGVCLGGALFCCCPLGPSAGGFTAAGVSIIPAILAVILGFIAKDGSGRGMAITGLILGTITVVLCIALAVISTLIVAGLIGMAANMPPPPPNQPPPFALRQRF